MSLFGTDGIRGRVGTGVFTEASMRKLGCAIGAWLARKKPSSKTVFIGRDTRESCELFEKMLAVGLKGHGFEAVSLGVVTTPAVSYLTSLFKSAVGVMISASHNLWHDNGIKLFGANGLKVPEGDEEMIESFFGNGDTRAHLMGTVKITKDLSINEEYVKFLLYLSEGLSLKGMRVIVDCANGSTSLCAPRLFRALGAETVAINKSPMGRNINLNCGSLHPEGAAEVVLKEKADMGLAFDGDGDRLIMIDDKGFILDGDYAMAIAASHMIEKGELKRRTVVATHMSNLGLERALINFGGRLLRTDVGDKNVLKEMLKGSFDLGGEQSGHIIFRRRSLTGDGLITAIEMLKLIAKKKAKLSSLKGCLKKYPQVLVNVNVQDKKPIKETKALNKCMTFWEGSLKDRGRLYVRYSGTEPLLRVMVEANTKSLAEKAASSVAKAAQEELG